MNGEGEARQPASLAEARETIARQAEELDRLRGALSFVATAGIIASPVTHARLLEMIVETAAHVIGSRAGALFLLDEEQGELTFEVAIGSKADAVKKLRVPLGHGVAGMVALSGQAIAISEAQSDPRLASDIVESVGYTPETLLCIPLFYGDRIIGTLELLDKKGGQPFSPADIEALGLFANQAAVALQLSRTSQGLAQLLREASAEAAGADTDAPPRDKLGADLPSRDALDLADLVHEIAHQGERERQACAAILRGLAEYLRARPGSSGDHSGTYR